MSDALKPQLHGRDHRPGGRDPIPGGPAVIELMNGTSGTDLAAAPTVVEFSESVSYHSGNYFQFNVGGNLEILAPGVYILTWSSRAYSMTGNKATTAELDVNVISGTPGDWLPGQFASGGIATVQPLQLPNIGPAVVDLTFYMSPDAMAIARWDSLDTFPVEIETEYAYTEDGASASQTTAIFAIGVVRLGDVFE